MRKPVFCKCENTEDDQLRRPGGNCTVDQRFFFFATYIDNANSLLSKSEFQASSHLKTVAVQPDCVGHGRKPLRTGFHVIRLFLLSMHHLQNVYP